MRIEQRLWTSERGWRPDEPPPTGDSADWVLIFGDTDRIRDPAMFGSIRKAYPEALIFGCSTAGEIAGSRVMDHSLAVTAVQFAHTRVRGVKVALEGEGGSLAAGERLATELPVNLGRRSGEPALPLVHVLVLSEGVHVNGSDLVRGMTMHLPPEVGITGGLAGDGTRFEQTTVVLDAPGQANLVAATGFYGSRLAVGFGSLGGWDPFGPERLVTRAQGNVLQSLDGQSALALYKKYLGSKAGELPSSGLLFPLSVRMHGSDIPVVRTLLAVDEAAGSLIFAGDVPEGSFARLMKANSDRLIDGAVGAARTSAEALEGSSPELAILISCVGRKLLLKQRTEEEVEGAQDVFGEGAVLTGFYSYGEISPFSKGGKCELHNQTMTITTLAER